jgi:peroxiredoxin
MSIPIVSLADLSIGETHALKFVDIDGNTLSTTDGHVIVLVLTTKADLPKAQAVGDRIPDFCLGNSAYRMITLVKFGQHSAPVRNFLTRMARRRLDAEGKRLQTRYATNKIARDARHDIFAAVDFDGSVVSQLDSGSILFRVFVFGRTGKLLKQWDDVPIATELAEALK